MNKEQLISRLYEYYVDSYNSISTSEGDFSKLKGWVKKIAYWYSRGTGDAAISWEDICGQVIVNNIFEKWINSNSVKSGLDKNPSMKTLLGFLESKILGYASSWIKGQRNKRDREVNEATLSHGEEGDDDEFTFSVENFPYEEEEEVKRGKDYESSDFWKVIVKTLEKYGFHKSTKEKYLAAIKLRADNPELTWRKIGEELGMNLMTFNTINQTMRSDGEMKWQMQLNYGYFVPEELEEESYLSAEDIEQEYGTQPFPYCENYVDQFEGEYQGSEKGYQIDKRSYKPGDEGYEELHKSFEKAKNHFKADPNPFLWG